MKVSASQLTTVTSSKAIIYADRQLSTPIGYLPSGKKIRVGEGQQRGGKVLPILITGRVAYIKVEDLDLREKYQGISNGKHTVEHNPDSQFTTIEDKLTENIFIIFSLSGLSTAKQETSDGDGIRTSSSGEERDDEDNNNITLQEYTLYLEHRQPYGRFSWGMGLGFLHSVTTGETINGLILRGVLRASVFKSHFITVDVAAEPFFSGDVSLGAVTSSASSLENEKLVGSLYGLRFALQANFFPLSKYGAIIGAGIERTYITQLKKTETLNEYSLTLNSNVIYAGMSYKF